MSERVHVKHDQEWVNLIKEAKELGLSVDEVRMFLEGKIRMEEVVKKGYIQKD